MTKIITKTRRTIETTTGLICDSCDMRDEQGFNNHHVTYRYGYGTELDMSTVEFSLCDSCLTTIVLDKIPRAKFTNSSGKEISVNKGESGFIISETEL